METFGGWTANVGSRQQTVEGNDTTQTALHHQAVKMSAGKDLESTLSFLHIMFPRFDQKWIYMQKIQLKAYFRSGIKLCSFSNLLKSLIWP